MRYRVIIADDEPKILQLIKMLGHWEEFQIEIVDECNNGRQTLESIRKNKPDFVLSDIKMPDLDGLKLIEETRKSGVDSLFILISGYRYFEYARSAVALNVVDYLLKPIDENQLNETLEKVCRKIEQKREMEHLRELEVQQFKERMELFWRMLFYEQERPNREKYLSSVYACNGQFGTGFQEGFFQVVSTVTGLNAITEQHDSMFRDKVDGFLRRIFAGKAYYYDYSTYRGRLIVLNFREENKVLVREAVEALFYSIRDLRGIYGDFQINFGCSSIKNSLAQLYQAYQEGEAAQWGRLIFVGNNIIEYSQIAHLPRMAPDGFLDREEINRLCDGICCLNREAVAELFAELNQRAAKMRHIYPGTLWESFRYLMQGVLKGMTGEKHKERMEERFHYAYVKAHNFQQVVKNVYIALDDYMAEKEKELREKMSKPMGDAIQFIKENYSRPISMEDAADAAGVSAGYLGKLFRREMDMGFNAYVTKIRLDRSQELLADTSMSIKEIALLVGYPDEKYYSRLFKKVTGIKPTDYRKLYGG